MFGGAVEREVSGWILENGDYIVLDPSKNTYKESFNNQLPTGYKSGVPYVKYGGKWYRIKSHFHIHPSFMDYPSGSLGVSGKDLNLMYNRLNGTPIYILYRGNEWQVIPGNDYSNFYKKIEYGYSLINLGKWK